MTLALRFVDVSCRFGAENVVDRVSLDIATGEIVCLLGPSGCGKTTSLRLAGGMEVPSSGEIWLGDTLVSTPDAIVPPEYRGVGFLFQDFALFPHLSVFDNVAFGISHLAAGERKHRTLELLDEVGLSDHADKFPHILSGGEQQRAALARALAPYPKLVLMDEPFSNLDPQLRDRMRDLMLRLLKQFGAAGLIVTHDAADALRMADRIAVQTNGRLVQIDTPQVVFNLPKTLDVAKMFGPLNQVGVRVQGGHAKCALGNFATNQPDGDYLLAIRPSDIGLATDMATDIKTGGGNRFVFDGKICSSRPLGNDWLCNIACTQTKDWQMLIPHNGQHDKQPVAGTHNFSAKTARLMLFSQ